MRHVIILMLAGLMACAVAIAVQRTRPPPAPSPGPLTIERIQPLASLLTTRVTIADVVYERLDGYTGSLKLAAIIHGDVLIRIDLAEAELSEVNPRRRTATLTLPPPQAISPRIDHERTRVVLVQTSGLWQIAATDDGRSELFDRAMAAAQRRIADAGSDRDLIQQSRNHAEQLIPAFAEQAMGWRIDIRWHPPNPAHPHDTP